MKLFRIRLEQEKNFRLGIVYTENVCLSVTDVCLSVTLNFLHTLILNTHHTLFLMLVCLSQFYFHECPNFMPLCYLESILWVSETWKSRTICSKFQSFLNKFAKIHRCCSTCRPLLTRALLNKCFVLKSQNHTGV